MPANKNAMTRYKILDELLSSRYHNYSLDDLTEEISNRLSEMDSNSDGVVRRTVEKDIKYLEYEGPFMVEIERHTIDYYDGKKQKTNRKKCLRYQKSGFSIFKKDLTEDEKYLLSEALSLLGQFDGLPNLDGLQGLRMGLGIRTNQKTISFSKNVLENSSILGQLFTAISQKLVIELHYHRFKDDHNILNINLHPYLLKEYNRRWFLFGAAESDNKLLCFALDRIDESIPLPSHKFIAYTGDLEEQFQDIIGVSNYLNKQVEHIEFWVSSTSMDYVMTKPLHDSQIHYKGEKENTYKQKYPSLETGAFFSIDCKENYELIRELSSFGENLIVLYPSCIQSKVYDRARNMTFKYEKLMGIQ